MLNLKNELVDAVVKHSSGIISNKVLCKIKDKTSWDTSSQWHPMLVSLFGRDWKWYLAAKKKKRGGKENTAKSQKEHSSSMIKEHMLFMLLCMCVNVFVLLVTHDEYEQKMELLVFFDMAAQLIELFCVFQSYFYFLLFKSCFHTLRPTVYRKTDTFKYCKTGIPFSFELSPERCGF